MVTAPVSKEAMRAGGYPWPGQTEMIASFCRVREFAMLLVTPEMRVAPATTHLPLRAVSKMITRERISTKLSVIHRCLRQDFRIRSPRIAVLGLNPHAGENGEIGTEELSQIIPAIRKAKYGGMRVRGPFPADAFFGTHAYRDYDAVLAMYHDQGLVPLKMSGIEKGVNFTAGLPLIRTSPDHGTAFDIAGRGIANPSSMVEAVKLAAAIANNRMKEH
jgi:4-hydroxythreonine-4-phosphate dehydrogenase